MNGLLIAAALTGLSAHANRRTPIGRVLNTEEREAICREELLMTWVGC